MKHSTAKAYIYAGMGLLIGALLLSLFSIYPRPWSLRVEKRLGLGEQLVIASLSGGREEGIVEWALLRMTTNCSGVVQLVVFNGTAADYMNIAPGQVLEANLSTRGAVAVQGLGGGEGCCVLVEALVAGRSYPYRWLSLPALALMLAGTASLTLGALLRLSGLEEDSL